VVRRNISKPRTRKIFIRKKGDINQGILIEEFSSGKNEESRGSQKKKDQMAACTGKGWGFEIQKNQGAQRVWAVLYQQGIL